MHDYHSNPSQNNVDAYMPYIEKPIVDLATDENPHSAPTTTKRGINLKTRLDFKV